jgi:hypothetical protein
VIENAEKEVSQTSSVESQQNNYVVLSLTEVCKQWVLLNVKDNETKRNAFNELYEKLREVAKWSEFGGKISNVIRYYGYDPEQLILQKTNNGLVKFYRKLLHVERVCKFPFDDDKKTTEFVFGEKVGDKLCEYVDKYLIVVLKEFGQYRKRDTILKDYVEDVKKTMDSKDLGDKINMFLYDFVFMTFQTRVLQPLRDKKNPSYASIFRKRFTHYNQWPGTGTLDPVCPYVLYPDNTTSNLVNKTEEKQGFVPRITEGYEADKILLKKLSRTPSFEHLLELNTFFGVSSQELRQMLDRDVAQAVASDDGEVDETEEDKVKNIGGNEEEGVVGEDEEDGVEEGEEEDEELSEQTDRDASDGGGVEEECEDAKSLFNAVTASVLGLRNKLEART